MLQVSANRTTSDQRPTPWWIALDGPSAGLTSFEFHKRTRKQKVNQLLHRRVSG